MNDESFFFFRIVNGKPEVYPITSSTKRLMLDEINYLMIELPKPSLKATKERKVEKKAADHPTDNSWSSTLARVHEYLDEAGKHGLSPLALREMLSDVWPVALGPILYRLSKTGVAERLSNGHWAIK